MIGKKVSHKSYGTGVIIERNENKIKVEFDIGTKTFIFPDSFDKFLSTDDDYILDQLRLTKEAQKTEEIKMNCNLNSTSDKKIHPQPSVPHRNNTTSSLIGARAQTIPVSSEYEMFELVGYMANPQKVGSIEAEVPKDGRDKIFERLFPGQKYRPIELGYTPSGLPNKVSPQFRINFRSLRNCPEILKNNIGKGNGACVGRINKSKFVLDVVQNYGFRFGEYQDVEFIKQNAEKKGYLEAYLKGFNR